MFILLFGDLKLKFKKEERGSKEQEYSPSAK